MKKERAMKETKSPVEQLKNLSFEPLDNEKVAANYLSHIQHAVEPWLQRDAGRVVIAERWVIDYDTTGLRVFDQAQDDASRGEHMITPVHATLDDRNSLYLLLTTLRKHQRAQSASQGRR